MCITQCFLLLIFQYFLFPSQPKISILGRATLFDKTTQTMKEKIRSISEFKDAEQIEGVLMIRFDESLYFGNCNYLKERLNRVEKFGSLSVHPGESPVREERRSHMNSELRSSLSRESGHMNRYSSRNGEMNRHPSGDRHPSGNGVLMSRGISGGSRLHRIIFSFASCQSIDAR